MCKRVGASQIQTAKKVDLVSFLQANYPNLIVYDSKSKRYLHRDHDSCVIVNVGFYRFSNGQRGDQIQFLEDFCGKTFQDAVMELCRYAGTDNSEMISKKAEMPEIKKGFTIPEATSGMYKNVWSFLVYKRGLPKIIIEKLFSDRKLYQAKEYNNCVFIADNYAEVVGTTDIKFKHIVPGSACDGYWCTGDEHAETVYICESAIDAISLMVLMKKYLPETKAAYTSMGGLKDKAVATLKEKYKNVILAVDNDERAKEYLKKYPDELKIIPPEIEGIKDWNDLLRYCTDVQKIIYTLKHESRDNSLPF